MPLALYVGHYGHPLLKGAKHWSFLLCSSGKQSVLAYQISGSTQTYEVKPPEQVVLEHSSAFMGKVLVGHIEENRFSAFEKAVLAVPVTRGNVAWNCQHWIIQVLVVLKANGFNVTDYKLEDLQKLLAEAKE